MINGVDSLLILLKHHCNNGVTIMVMVVMAMIDNTFITQTCVFCSCV